MEPCSGSLARSTTVLARDRWQDPLRCWRGIFSKIHYGGSLAMREEFSRASKEIIYDSLRDCGTMNA